jgi:YggT family protein
MRFIQDLLTLYILVFVAAAVLSWFPPHSSSDGLATAQRVLAKLTEPVLRPLRQIVPRTRSGIDFSPLVAVVILSIIRAYI